MAKVAAAAQGPMDMPANPALNINEYTLDLDPARQQFWKSNPSDLGKENTDYATEWRSTKVYRLGKLSTQNLSQASERDEQAQGHSKP